MSFLFPLFIPHSKRDCTVKSSMVPRFRERGEWWWLLCGQNQYLCFATSSTKENPRKKKKKRSWSYDLDGIAMLLLTSLWNNKKWEVAKWHQNLIKDESSPPNKPLKFFWVIHDFKTCNQIIWLLSTKHYPMFGWRERRRECPLNPSPYVPKVLCILTTRMLYIWTKICQCSPKEEGGNSTEGNRYLSVMLINFLSMWCRYLHSVFNMMQRIVCLGNQLLHFTHTMNMAVSATLVKVGLLFTNLHSAIYLLSIDK